MQPPTIQCGGALRAPVENHSRRAIKKVGPASLNDRLNCSYNGDVSLPLRTAKFNGTSGRSGKIGMMKKRACILAVPVLLALALSPAGALEPTTLITQYGHAVWRVRDGVLTAAPTAVAQTKDGYIWIGTETGLLRFDGNRFEQWAPAHWDEVRDHTVDDLLTASDGTLWIGTSSNLASWKDGKLTVAGPPGVEGWVNKIVEDRRHRIWVAMTRRLDRQPLCQALGTALRCYGPSDGLSLPFGLSLSLNSDGSLSVGSSDTVEKWSPERGKIVSAKASGVSQFAGLKVIAYIDAQSDGSALVGIRINGRGLGLQRLRGNSFTPYTAAGLDSSSLDVETLFTDRSGALWIGTSQSGLYRVVNGAAEHYTTKEGLSGDYVRAFYEDREGNMWVVTDGGLDCFHDLKVLSWSTAEGLPSGSVFSISAGKDGSVLVGVENSLSILRNGKVTSISGIPGMPAGYVNAVLEDNAGRYWAGIGNQLTIFDGHKFTAVLRPDGRPTGIITSLAQAPDGSIWAIGLPRPMTLFHLRHGSITDVFEGGENGDVVASDGSTGAWSAIAGRLIHYASGHATSFQLGTAQGRARFGKVIAIVTSPDGAVWVSGRDGVWLFKDGRSHLLGASNGLPCENVTGLVFSKTQSLWMRADCGVIEVPDDSLNAWMADPSSAVRYRIIDPSDGASLSSAVFSPQMALAPDGRIWIANLTAIEVLDPDHIPMNRLPPPVHIEAILADRKRFSLTSGLQLPALTRDIEIQYTALSFVAPQKVRFRYMLDGRDTKWQDPGTRRAAFYQDLKPGHYRFHVVAANNDGVWNETGDSFDFYIKPAWFQTVWFRLLWITSVCLLLVALYRIRVRAIARAMSARFDERLDERTRMARELHDTFLQTVQGSKIVADDALASGTDQERMRRALEKLSFWLGQAVSEGRTALHALRVSTTEKNELAEFLERTLKEQCHDPNVSVATTVIGDARNLHPIVRDEVSLIAREAIHNACAHSKASQLRVELRYAEDLRLCIRDNGIGIDPDVLDAGKTGHFGLRGIRERSACIRAKLTISSSRIHGTDVTLKIPGDVAYLSGKRSRIARYAALVGKWLSKPGRGSSE